MKTVSIVLAFSLIGMCFNCLADEKSDDSATLLPCTPPSVPMKQSADSVLYPIPDPDPCPTPSPIPTPPPPPAPEEPTGVSPKIRDYDEIKKEFQIKGYVDIVIQINDDELQESVVSLTEQYNRKQYSPEIIAYKAAARTEIKNNILSSGSLVENDYEILTMLSNTSLFAIRLYNLQAIYILVDNVNVKYVFKVKPVESSGLYFDKEAAEAIEQPIVNTSGYRGKGSVIAIVDENFSLDIPEIGDCVDEAGLFTAGENCKVISVNDCGFFFEAPTQNRYYCISRRLPHQGGHGDKVLAMAAQIAPDAKYIVFDYSNDDPSLSLYAAVQVILGWYSDYSYKIDAVNMSFILPGMYSPGVCNGGDTEFDALLGDMSLADIVPIAASGNDGKKFGMPVPACIRWATSVGATYSEPMRYQDVPYCEDTGSVKNQLVCFSNRSASLDFVAPGAGYHDNTGTSYFGTSFAAPTFTGAFAVLRAAAPSLSNKALLDVMKSTGIPINDPYFNGERKYPLVQLDRAISYLSSTGDTETGSGSDIGEGDQDQDQGSVAVDIVLIILNNLL